MKQQIQTNIDVSKTEQMFFVMQKRRVITSSTSFAGRTYIFDNSEHIYRCSRLDVFDRSVNVRCAQLRLRLFTWQRIIIQVRWRRYCVSSWCSNGTPSIRNTALWRLSSCLCVQHHIARWRLCRRMRFGYCGRWLARNTLSSITSVCQLNFLAASGWLVDGLAYFWTRRIFNIRLSLRRYLNANIETSILQSQYQLIQTYQ